MLRFAFLTRKEHKMKRILHLTMLAVMILFTACTCPTHCECVGDTIPEKQPKPTPAEAIELLKAGNRRFLNNECRSFRLNKKYISFVKGASQGDFAYATIISCSDSRVPVERIFDSCFMELFVIRVAGNVFQTAELGSAEYGVFHVQTPVLVVLGHTECGAVSAVVDECCGHHHHVEKNVKNMLAPIYLPAQKVVKENPKLDMQNIKRLAVAENVRHSISTLLTQSEDIRQAVETGKCAVVGAVYDMDTDEVCFMDISETHKILKNIK